MNKLTQEFIRPYVEEYVKLKCPRYSQRMVNTVVNSTISCDNGMSNLLRNYIFGCIHAKIVELEVENAVLKAQLE